MGIDQIRTVGLRLLKFQVLVLLFDVVGIDQIRTVGLRPFLCLSDIESDFAQWELTRSGRWDCDLTAALIGWTAAEVRWELTRSGRWDCDEPEFGIFENEVAVTVGIDQIRTVGLRPSEDPTSLMG